MDDDDVVGVVGVMDGEVTDGKLHWGSPGMVHVVACLDVDSPPHPIDHNRLVAEECPGWQSCPQTPRRRSDGGASRRASFLHRLTQSVPVT